MSEAIVDVCGLSSGYGSTQALFDVEIVVPRATCVAVLGLNGAGKTTLLKTIMGELTAWAGRARVAGEDVTALRTDEIVRRGVGYVPQEHSVFASLSVRDNLTLGSIQGRAAATDRIEHVLEVFPKLRHRLAQAAGTLSGGERKMLALARALVGEPTVLLLDEVTEGVWPGVVAEIGDRLREFASEHSILLVEHNVEFALAIADEVYVLDRGRVAAHGAAASVRQDPHALRFLMPGEVRVGGTNDELGTST